MLDTSICVELLRTGRPKMFSRMRRFEIDEIAISSITMAELQYCVARSARPGYHEMLLAEFCAPLAIVPFDHLAAEAHGKARATLERAGTPIGPLDTLIAAHALSMNVALVTNNEREFQRVPGLRLENWNRS